MIMIIDHTLIIIMKTKSSSDCCQQTQHATRQSVRLLSETNIYLEMVSFGSIKCLSKC